MPLPKATERAAVAVSLVFARLDRAVEDHIATGAALPSVASIMTELRPIVRDAVTAALRDADRRVTGRAVIEASQPVETALRAQVTQTLRAAQRARRKVPRRIPERAESETVAAFVKRVGAVAALAALARPRRGRRRTIAVRDIARTVGARIPTRTQGWARMVIRTEATRARNTLAADIAERDGLVVLIEDGRNGPTDHECERVNGRYATVAWFRKHPLEHPNCVAAGQTVTGQGHVSAAWSRSFDGETVRIVTASGAELTVTPNHPVLTSDGFHPADTIKPGTEVFRYVGGETLRGSVPHDVQGVPLIEQVADALSESFGVSAMRVPSAPEQFHGDGSANGDVHVVWTDRFLSDDLPELVEPPGQSLLVDGADRTMFAGESAGVEVGVGAGHAAHGVVSGSGDGGAPVLADAFHVQPFRFGPAAGLAPRPEVPADGRATARERLSDHVGRFPASVSLDDLSADRVVSVEVLPRDFVQVHDLSTSGGWFACNGIVVSNCTRRGTPTKLPDGKRVTLIE